MELKESILRTITFFGLFEHPLTAEEILEYLYGSQKPVHIKEIRGILDGMMPVIERIHDYFVPRGKGEWIESRRARKFISEKYWGRVRQYGQYVARMPFVEMVAVCNNLSYDNADESSDIDLFIIIREGRMWFARLLITLILQFFGVRRRGNKIAGRFCLSFFVTPEKLDISEHILEPEDPYLAYWTKLLMPVYGESMYRRFMEENKKWIWDRCGLRFADASRKQLSFSGKAPMKKFLEWIFGGRLGDKIEWILKKTFKKRTLRRQKIVGAAGSVIVRDDILKFHNHDRRREYWERWVTESRKLLNALSILEKTGKQADGQNIYDLCPPRRIEF